jgi:hypothetical protein
MSKTMGERDNQRGGGTNNASALRTCFAVGERAMVRVALALPVLVLQLARLSQIDLARIQNTFFDLFRLPLSGEVSQPAA